MKLFILAALLATGSAMAQERTAGGSLETQMTWSALSSQISTMGAKVDAANTRVDQIVLCGKKGMVYAPGATGADTQGCLAAAVTPPTSGPVPYKIESKGFTGGIPIRMTVSSFCTSKGYEAFSGSTSVTSERHTGGSTGGTETTTTTTYYCTRIAPR